MVNVGTGNLLLQDDDMAVAHKGVSLAFRRTYNSQSQHDVAGTDGTEPSMYGNGWTSSFDAHIAGSSSGTISVFDIDGARYDYTIAADGISHVPPPGQYASLVSDGGCGYLWTKKSGTTYYFWTPDGAGPCTSSWYPSYGAYAGRTYQIIGRNRNTFLQFNYSWDNGNSAAGGKISQVQAQAESGLTATLSFADVSGHRLLQQLTYPDGVTSVVYGYDTAGNLTSVAEPAYDAAGDRATHGYGYQTLGTGTIIYYVTSPRWTGSDGGYTAFGFSGSAPATSAASYIIRAGVVNPTIPDGTNSGPLQSGYATGVQQYDVEWFGTTGTYPWFHDSDGRLIYWIVDSMARMTQTQTCTVTSGWNCVGPMLISNETWDSSNNLAHEVDPRGNETDYIYDLAGNTTVVGEPQTATSQGTFKPTKIYDYDAYNNVVAYCDESESHAAGADWVPGTTRSVYPNDSLCATYGGSVAHWHASYTYPSYQPYGELQSMTSPLGFVKTLAYAPSQQAGSDYGLPTSVTGTSFTQADGTTRTPNQTFWYDAAGNVRCFSKGQGTTVLAYDALGRITSVADPDDSSANASSLCGKSTGQPGWNTQSTYAYFPDGLVQSSQTPAERLGGVATTFTYDADGNPTTETRHFNCMPGGTCTPGVTTKWYDGGDRLVEVGLPHDGSDYYGSPWLTRYLYDISGGGSVSIAGTSFRAYGNLSKTQEWAPMTATAAPAWLDLKATAFDGVDRAVAKYGFSPGSNTTLRATTMTYDTSTALMGMLASQTDPLSQTTAMTYDPAGHTTSVTFSGDGGVTPNKSFVYDAMGRVTSATGSVYGTETTRYDADGRAIEIDEPTSGAITSPARVTYDYYIDGTRKAVNVASTALNAAPLMSYAYRADGKRRWVHVGFGQQQGNFVTTYTDSGRAISRSDPFTGTVMPSPRSPVAPGTTYPQTTWTYDAAGQTTGTTLPQTFAYQAIGHDDESVITSWTGSSSANGPATMTFANTNRGENVYQSLGTAQAASYQVNIANGAVVRTQHGTNLRSGPPSTGLATAVDPVNAVVASTSKDVYVSNPDPDIRGWINCGNATTTNNYDAASRLLGTTQSMSNVNPDPNCPGMEGPIGEQRYSYDAENHHLDVVTFGSGPFLQWSPTGHAYKFPSSLANVHYDGGGILFITDPSGALSQVKIEALADIDASGQLTVLDRDFSGQYVSRHNNVAYGGVWLGTTLYNNNSTAPSTVPYVFWGSTNDTSCRTDNSGTHCDPAGALEYGRLEGFDYGGLTFQGARTVDSASGQWTTPDAFAGNVHDPQSQKAFMWDRNNAYAWSDPSGFAPHAVTSVNEDGSFAGLGHGGGGGGDSGSSDSVDVAYDPSAVLTPNDALSVVENIINKLNRGTNPTNPQQYLDGLKNALNYNLKNNNGGAYTFDFKSGQASPTLVSRNGAIRIYVSMKAGWEGAAQYRGSIRVDVTVLKNTTSYRYYNLNGMLWRGFKDVNLPSSPFGLSRSGKD